MSLNERSIHPLQTQQGRTHSAQLRGDAHGCCADRSVWILAASPEQRRAAISVTQLERKCLSDLLRETVLEISVRARLRGFPF